LIAKGTPKNEENNGTKSPIVDENLASGTHIEIKLTNGSRSGSIEGSLQSVRKSLESSKNINKRTVKKQRYNLISEIQKHYDLNEFFNHKLPNYKTQAAFYTLLEAYALDNMVNPNVIIANKVTILEHLTAATITEKQVRDNVLDEFKKSDKDLRTLTYRIILEKFNGKYDELNTHQKSILKELINSIDNSPRLKEFYSSKSTEIREELTKLNKKVKDQVTKIKVNEIISLMKPLDKNVKVSDNDLINLLQYCDLVNELESANA
jgi:hypothetical protein